VTENKQDWKKIAEENRRKLKENKVFMEEKLMPALEELKNTPEYILQENRHIMDAMRGIGIKFPGDEGYVEPADDAEDDEDDAE